MKGDKQRLERKDKKRERQTYSSSINYRGPPYKGPPEKGREEVEP